MAIIPNDQRIHTVSADVDTRNRKSALLNSNVESVTMADITTTVINSGGGGGLSGAGQAFFVPVWESGTNVGVSDIERTAIYSAPNGGQYELRGNLKIFGESSSSGVAALFIEDSINARVQIRDVDDATGAIKSELELVSSDLSVRLGTSVNSTVDSLFITSFGNSKFSFRTQPIQGTDYFCFSDSGNGALCSPTVGGGFEKVFFNLDAYADDTAAGAAGLTVDQLYQTDGTGAAPLNVAGIIMAKQ